MKSVELINNLIKYIIDNSKLPDYSDIDTITRHMNYDLIDIEFDDN